MELRNLSGERSEAKRRTFTTETALKGSIPPETGSHMLMSTRGEWGLRAEAQAEGRSPQRKDEAWTPRRRSEGPAWHTAGRTRKTLGLPEKQRWLPRESSAAALLLLTCAQDEGPCPEEHRRRANWLQSTP